MPYPFLRASLLILAVAFAAAAQTAAPEVVSPLGAKFYAQADEKGEIEQAQKRLAADPRNIELLIALGRAQAAAWRYNDAIATYTRGIEIDPSNAMLYRHRGHRYISTRRFDKAIADLDRAARLNEKDFDIWYHLGLAHYLTGQFERAAAAYERCRAVADKDDSVIAVSDWLYMTYRRMGKDAESRAVLERIRPDMKVEENKSYFDRLLLYKGLKKEGEILTANLTDLELATVGYGIANWRLYNGDRAGAEELLRKIVAGKYWPAFGFIAAEAELARWK